MTTANTNIPGISHIRKWSDGQFIFSLSATICRQKRQKGARAWRWCFLIVRCVYSPLVDSYFLTLFLQFFPGNCLEHAEKAQRFQSSRQPC